MHDCRDGEVDQRQQNLIGSNDIFGLLFVVHFLLLPFSFLFGLVENEQDSGTQQDNCRDCLNDKTSTNNALNKHFPA